MVGRVSTRCGCWPLAAAATGQRGSRRVGGACSGPQGTRRRRCRDGSRLRGVCRPRKINSLQRSGCRCCCIDGSAAAKHCARLADLQRRDLTQAQIRGDHARDPQSSTRGIKCVACEHARSPAPPMPAGRRRGVRVNGRPAGRAAAAAAAGRPAAHAGPRPRPRDDAPRVPQVARHQVRLMAVNCHPKATQTRSRRVRRLGDAIDRRRELPHVLSHFACSCVAAVQASPAIFSPCVHSDCARRPP